MINEQYLRIRDQIKSLQKTIDDGNTILEPLKMAIEIITHENIVENSSSDFSDVLLDNSKEIEKIINHIDRSIFENVMDKTEIKPEHFYDAIKELN